MNRRQLIKGIGAAICAGAIPPFIPGLLPEAVDYREAWGSLPFFSRVGGAISINLDGEVVAVGRLASWEIKTPPRGP